MANRALNFNPRTRVGCDLGVGGKPFARIVISIHAPAWGATCHVRQLARHREISIHAPAWGATRKYAVVFGGSAFQSTHPRGVRPAVPTKFINTGDISIHAPAWGATFDNNNKFAQVIISIHAPAWGATLATVVWEASIFVFQSTHPRGVRRDRQRIYRLAGDYFNPRTRVGCDLRNGFRIWLHH